jgi:hypothetical protein
LLLFCCCCWTSSLTQGKLDSVCSTTGHWEEHLDPGQK